MRDRQTCVGCGKKSPETETNYTLISAQFGWRLTRHHGPEGSLVVEWRCPTCWRDFKRSRPVAAGSAGGIPSPPPDAPLRTPPVRRTPVAEPMTPFESFRVPVRDDPPVRRAGPGISTPPPASGPTSSRPPNSGSKPSSPSRRGGSSE